MLGGEALGGGDGVAVQLCGELGLAVVAAAVEDGDRDAVFDEGGEQDFVAALDVAQGKVHLAEAVVSMIVGTGNPDDEIGREVVERFRQRGEELLEIHFSFDIADGFDIEAAGDFFCRVVFADVDGVGENPWIVTEKGGGAVALMGVRIDDHDFDVRLFVLKIADGDGDVVENAIALAVFAEGVMSAAGETDADSFFEGGVAGEAGGLHLGGAAGEQASRCGKAEEDLLLAIERAGFDLADVVGFVDALEQVEISGADFDDFLRFENAAGEQHVFGDPEFVHGKRVSGGQIEFEFLGIKAAHEVRANQQRKRRNSNGKVRIACRVTSWR